MSGLRYTEEFKRDPVAQVTDRGYGPCLWNANALAIAVCIFFSREKASTSTTKNYGDCTKKKAWQYASVMVANGPFLLQLPYDLVCYDLIYFI